jgi:hypothetical protein
MYIMKSRPRGAVVKAEAHRSGDSCVPGSNPTVSPSEKTV